jgi:hypothetical protein
MINEQIKVTGDVTVVITGPDGIEKDRREIKNLVVTTGKSFIASRMIDASQTTMSNMAVGSGSTAAAAADTALGSELGRVTLSSASASGQTSTYAATFPPGTGTGAITEAGLFNNSTGGTMLCRTVFSVVNKGASDAMSITWAVTVS